MKKALITVENLTKSYGQTTILNQVSFELLEGEILVVLGASGAGKTTLLNILSRLERDYEGSVKYAGDIFKDKTVPLPVVFQDFDQLLPWYTVKENILLPFERKEFTPEDKEIIDFLGLLEDLQKYPHELSGGMKQRTAIGRSLLSDGCCIFMDEPFGSLDNQRRQQLQVLILEINKRYGRTILFITHDIEEARFLAHRIGEIDSRGRLSIVDKAVYSSS